MTRSVLTAGGGDWEAELVAGLADGGLGLRVSRRCVDLADLLAVAATGTAEAAVVGLALRGLDRDALDRLAALGVGVVGVVGGPADEARRQRLALESWVPADAGPARVAEVVTELLARLQRGGGFGYADPRAAAAAPPRAQLPAAPRAAAIDRAGRVVAVWGPTGAPGRTTVALGLAAEAAAAGRPSLLVDADVYGGALAQLLGVLDDAAGVLAAARLAATGGLDPAALAGLARTVAPRLRLLTGPGRPDRWPELRAAAVPSLLECCRQVAELTVVDTGFCLEEDEELAYDTLAPRRNGATLAVLAGADTVLAVGSADPVGLARLVRGLAELRERLPDVAPRVVLNRVRRTVAGNASAAQAAEALERFAGVGPAAVLPADQAAVDAAASAGATLVEVAAGSPLRAGLADLAGSLLGHPAGAGRRLRRRGRR